MTLTITIYGESLPSWNAVMRMHKHAQHDVQQVWLTLTTQAIGFDYVPFTKPVDVCVTSYQKGRMIDPDNLYCKGAIDGLKKKLFPDDSPKWIDSVKLRSRKAKTSYVTIQLTPVEGDV